MLNRSDPKNTSGFSSLYTTINGAPNACKQNDHQSNYIFHWQLSSDVQLNLTKHLKLLTVISMCAA